jgi:hypothetical protein
MKKLALLLLLSLVTAHAEELFNGKDLKGWTAFSSKEGVKLEDVWSVKDGVIVCKGEPIGWLATEKTYTNYKLTVEWRWGDPQKPGNSGLFQRIHGEPQTLPCSIECQLKHESAGDLMGFQGMTISGDATRAMKPKKFALGELTGGVKKLAMAEKKAGEWNRAEVTVQGDKITVLVNGQKVNEVTGVKIVAGRIGLQSEGGEIHFRNISVTALD